MARLQAALLTLIGWFFTLLIVAGVMYVISGISLVLFGLVAFRFVTRILELTLLLSFVLLMAFLLIHWIVLLIRHLI